MSLAPANAASSPRIFGTFGLYRYFLAVLVMMNHVVYIHMGFASNYAVFAFFILSGYVVCYILHYDYLLQKNGLLHYAINRGLRIYPLYWLGSLFMLWLLWAYHPEKIFGSPALGYPPGLTTGQFITWITLNLSALVSLPLLGGQLTPTLMPVGWSLGVEIFYWALMPQLLLRPGLRKYAVVFTIIYTLFALGVSFKAGHDIAALRYFSPLAASLPFLIGCFCFLRKLRGGPRISHTMGIGAIIAFLALICLVPLLFDNPYLAGFYPAIALNTVIILYLGQFDQKQVPAALRRADVFMGNLAYPIFILHVPVAVTLFVVLPKLWPVPVHGFALFLLVFILTNGVAILCHYLLEVPVNKLRRIIRGR